MHRWCSLHPIMDRLLADMLPHTDIASFVRPQMLGLLLDRWYGDQPRTTALRQTLFYCLSHLQPEHVELIDAAHKKQLYFELQRKRNDPYLVCAILKGLAGIEDRTPVADIILLADGKRSAVEFPQIQTAAREYLLALDNCLL